MNRPGAFPPAHTSSRDDAGGTGPPHGRAARQPVVRASAPAPLRVPRHILHETFEYIRSCGRGRVECQVLWIGPWSHPSVVTEAIHPVHRAHWGGFVLDNAWLTEFWLRLADRSEGIRAQVHSHPKEAFHSETDDAWPIVHLEGFLSLVIPEFAVGSVDLERSFLAEIGADGEFHEVDPLTRLALV